MKRIVVWVYLKVADYDKSTTAMDYTQPSFVSWVKYFVILFSFPFFALLLFSALILTKFPNIVNELTRKSQFWFNIFQDDVINYDEFIRISDQNPSSYSSHNWKKEGF